MTHLQRDWAGQLPSDVASFALIYSSSVYVRRYCHPLQMLAFGKQPHLPLSAAVLPFWVSLLQQSAPRAELATPRHTPLPDDAAAALLDLAGQAPFPRNLCDRRMAASAGVKDMQLL